MASTKRSVLEEASKVVKKSQLVSGMSCKLLQLSRKI